MTTPLRSALRDALSFVGIFGSLAASVAWTLVGIRDPVGRAPHVASEPLGYTRSLLLFLVPLAILGGWLWRRRDLRLPRRAFWRSVAVLTPLGFGLDLLFARTFFLFPSPEATWAHCEATPWFPACVPAVGGWVPIEEFVFYLSGFMVVLLAYVWADEFWFERYNVPDYRAASRAVPRIVRFHPQALSLGAALLALAFGLRWLRDGLDDGWPAYACYLVLVGAVPAIGLFRSAREVINWRAFNFVFFQVLLVSLLWEVTLALPYGWWDYNHRWMVGVSITPWFGLPLDAVFVWLAVTFTTVTVYEVIKLWLASGRKVREAFLGPLGG